MTTDTARDVLGDLASALAGYLTIIGATADCLETACPNVGGPYRQRLNRLRARLSYDPRRELLRERTECFQVELKDYATAAGNYLGRRSVEMERGMLALRDLVAQAGKRQAGSFDRLRRLADRLGNGEPSSELRDCVERLEMDAVSLSVRIEREMEEMDRRLAGTESVDPVTGLINRREFDRQIALHESLGATFTLLLLELDGLVSEQVMRQAAASLSGQFRHCDRFARWSERTLALLFLGDTELAQARVGQVLPFIARRYTLDSGQTVDITARVRVLQRELAMSA